MSEYPQDPKPQELYPQVSPMILKSLRESQMYQQKIPKSRMYRLETFLTSPMSRKPMSPQALPFEEALSPVSSGMSQAGPRDGPRVRASEKAKA